MSRALCIIVILSLLLPGCGDEEIPTSGVDSIDNILYGNGPYYALGFSFYSASAVSTLATPGPDIVLYMNMDDFANPRPTFQSSSLMPSFSLKGEYPDEKAAIAAFDGLKSVGAASWTDMADPVKANQLWLYRTGDEKYAKIRIISIVSENRPDLPFRYGKCTFEWVYQPDGSETFGAR